MDFQNRVGSKTGGGGVAGWSESNRDRKERLKKLAMETIDINKVNISQYNYCRVLSHNFSALSLGSVFHEEPSWSI